MIDLSNYNIYENKDGRLRAYNKTTHKVTSYPRVLMESILGRPLLPTEDVHHKDENPRNNNLDNLEVIDHRAHTREHAINSDFAKRKYFSKNMICPVCGQIFIWSEKSQANHARKKRVGGPFCSRSCAGKVTGPMSSGRKKKPA